MSKEIQTFSSQEVELIKNTVAKGATDLELKLFLEVCKGTQLNPFKKEIWFIKDKTGKVQIMTGVHGFYTLANSHPEFDGTEIIEGEVKEVEVKAGKKITVPSYVDCKVYRKDRKFPSVARAKWDEYAGGLLTQYGNLSIWAQKPSIMLSKCAESMALRKAFPQELNGLYTQEEMPENFASPKKDIEVKGEELGTEPIEEIFYNFNSATDKQKEFLTTKGADLGLTNCGDSLFIGKNKIEKFASFEIDSETFKKLEVEYAQNRKEK